MKQLQVQKQHHNTSSFKVRIIQQDGSLMKAKKGHVMKFTFVSGQCTKNPPYY
jgi:hypothetical protein